MESCWSVYKVQCGGSADEQGVETREENDREVNLERYRKVRREEQSVEFIIL